MLVEYIIVDICLYLFYTCIIVGYIGRLPPLPRTPISTRVGELCVVECFFCNVGFKYSCMRSVRGRGLGALGMSTRVGELCVVKCVCRSFVDAGFK